MDPASYRLRVSVEFETGSFVGEVDLDSNGTPTQTLNAVGLEILGATVGGQPHPVRIDAPKEEIHLEGLPPRSVPLSIRYRGRVGEGQLTGAYWSTYAPGRFLTTHFAPVSARRFVPCVDQPGAKAEFHVEVSVRKDLTVVFNTPVTARREEGERQHLTFAPTPKMSSYLLYLGIGTVDSRELRQGDLHLRVITPPGRGASGEWALQESGPIVATYGAFFGIPYPLPKLDLVAVPDFAQGAMENWGAITFREILLLTTPSTSTLLRREILETVAHEIAHQWFGNLVTMAWWDDIWLNESFATYMAYIVIHKLHPDMEIWNDFLLRWTYEGFNGDSLAETHPIQVHVKDPGEINQIFDEISYGKGASVLRMISDFLGEEDFRKGVSAYLSAHAYGVAEGSELWVNLEKASDRPVARIMEAWIKTAGHPIVEVHRNGSEVDLTQRLFRFLPTTSPTVVWPVPLTYRVGETTGALLMETPKAHLHLPLPGLLKLNNSGAGFYRVKYDEPGYRALREGYSTLAPFDRYNLLNDLGDFLWAGEVETSTYLEFVEEARRHPHALTTTLVARQLSRLLNLLSDRTALVEPARAFLRAEAVRLGLEPRPGDSDRDSVAREQVLMVQALHDPSAAPGLAAHFSRYDALNADIRAGVCFAYAKAGGAAEAQVLRDRLKAAKSEAEFEHFGQALMSFTDPALVLPTLNEIADGRIPPGFAYRLLTTVFRNPEIRPAVWTWVQSNLAKVLGRYEGTGLSGTIVEVAMWFLAVGREDEVLRYFEAHTFPETDLSVRKGRERIQIVRALRGRIR